MIVVTAVILVLYPMTRLPSLVSGGGRLDTLDKVSSIGSFLLAVVLATATVGPRARSERSGAPSKTRTAMIRLLFQTRRRYSAYVIARNRDMDLRGLSVQGPYALAVEHVFVDVSLVPRSIGRTTADPLDIPVESGRRPIWSFLRQWPPRTLAIVGPPGSGKTTLLKHLALRLAGGEETGTMPRAVRGRVPIIVLLRDHALTIAEDPDLTLVHVAGATLGPSMQYGHGWLTRQLERGNCLIMLDGLDEIANVAHRQAVVRWVDREIAAHHANGFIVTSRPYGYRSNPLSSADILQVRPFTDQQIELFLQRWSLATEIRFAGLDDEVVRSLAAANSADLLGRLRKAQHLYDLAVNPLLLTMMAHVHKYRGVLPGSRAELYREICQVFLGRRQSGKGLAVELTADQRESVLRPLAYEMMKRRWRDIPASEAAQVIHRQVSRVAPGVPPEQFLQATEQLSGLIIERESGSYSFAHLTFQEYLAAARIRDLGEIKELLTRADDTWWREVILLYCASADAGPVVEACLTTDTARSLLLASDCSAAARELDPAIRGRLQQTLSAETHSSNPVRAQLIGEVVLARKLRRTNRTPDGQMVVGEPITNAEYALFIRAELSAGRDRRPLHWSEDLVAEQPDAPATGVTASDARDFGAWLSFGEGWVYEALPADPMAVEGVEARSDIAVLREWARRVDWRALRSGAPHALFRAAPFLQEIGATDDLAGHRRPDLNRGWADLDEELQRQFDAWSPDQLPPLPPAAAAATRLLNGICRAYRHGDLRHLKLWQLESDGHLADGDEDEIDEEPTYVTRQSVRDSLDPRFVGLTERRIDADLGRVARHVYPRADRPYSLSLADRLRLAQGNERIPSEQLYHAADHLHAAETAWSGWIAGPERCRTDLVTLTGHLYRLLSKVAKDTPELLEATVRLLDAAIALQWLAHGRLREDSELWLKRT